jgi:hypothetical protein
VGAFGVGAFGVGAFGVDAYCGCTYELYRIALTKRISLTSKNQRMKLKDFKFTLELIIEHININNQNNGRL